MFKEVNSSLKFSKRGPWSDITEIREAAEAHFGIPSLYKFQEDILSALARGEDVFASQATGSGKSITFQLPALMRKGGTVVVISPLISLMYDQIGELRAGGIKVAVLDSHQSEAIYQLELESVKSGDVSLLYVSPERATSSRFITEIKDLPVWLVAVDEADCISHWAHSFRPSYLKIPKLLEAIGDPQVLAVTASAPALMRDDIKGALKIAGATEIHGSIWRDNIQFAIERFTETSEKREKFFRYLKEFENENGAAIVYASTTRTVDSLTAEAKSRGINAEAYHGKRTFEERKDAQDRFNSGEVKVIIATNSFGRGINKKDIRAIFHFEIPGSPEAYVQEVGRAGRDGEPSRAVLFYHQDDVAIQKNFLLGRHPSKATIRETYRRICHHLLEEKRGGAGPNYFLPDLRILLKPWEGIARESEINAAVVFLEASGYLESDRPYFTLTRKADEIETDFPLDEELMRRCKEHDLFKAETIIRYALADQGHRAILEDYFARQTCPVLDESFFPPLRTPQTSESLRIILWTLSDKDHDTKSLIATLRSTAVDGGVFLNALAGRTYNEVERELEYAEKLGYISKENVAKRDLYFLTEEGIKALENLGIELKPPQSLDELLMRPLNSQSLSIIKPKLADLFTTLRNLKGKALDKQINDVAEKFLEARLCLFGEEVRVVDLAGSLLQRNPAEVDRVLLRIYLKAIFAEELNTKNRG